MTTTTTKALWFFFFVFGSLQYAYPHNVTAQNRNNIVLVSSSVKDSLGYSDAILAVTDRASERDAYSRLMVLLGDRIVDELLRSETLYDET